MEGKTISDLFINEQIRDREVRVIGADGEQLGVMPTREAMKLAEEAGVDLVKIAPTAKPPVCKIVDYGIKDSMNMGACMAPAAADTIRQNLEDFGRSPKDYDKIITGDLGTVGQQLLFDLLSEMQIDITKQHMDCGIEIFDSERQHTDAGGSGCGCSAVVLSAYILKKLQEGVWKRVLFVPTGALLSKTSFNEGQTIPGIAHGVILEHY